jgi:myxalamid-type polyketide synthase MxaE and MxaD
MLEAYLLGQSATVLGLPASRLTTGSCLARAGLDSLMALELRNRVRADLGVVIPVSPVGEETTVADLAALLLELLTGATAGEGRAVRELTPV